MKNFFLVTAFCSLVACSDPPAKPVIPLDTQVRPALTLRAEIAEHGALRIPRRAVIERTGVIGVYVLSPKSEARFRMVKVGRLRGDDIEILSGLHGTETLVLGDLTSIHDGTPIKVE